MDAQRYKNKLIYVKPFFFNGKNTGPSIVGWSPLGPHTQQNVVRFFITRALMRSL